MKRRFDAEPECSAKRVYNAEVNRMAVADAAVAPAHSSVERTLQRHLSNFGHHYLLHVQISFYQLI
jgi:hypothetical protein